MDQLMVQVDEGGSRPCGVEGDSLLEVWRKWEGAGCSGARPFGGGRALVAYLIGRGSSPSRRFGDFLLFLHAAKS